MRITVLTTVAALLLLGQAAAQAPAADPGTGLYQQHCAVCHGSNGEGEIGPALAGNANLANTTAMLNIVLFGAAAMPAWGNQLTDEQIAQVTTHERTSWGNAFGEITTEQVTAQRGQGQGADGAAPASQAAAQPVSVAAAEDAELGNHLVTGDGIAIYRFVNDGPTGASTCYEPCIHRWIPLLTSDAPAAGTGIDAAALGTTQRDDGTLQATYRGWPLYTYLGDAQLKATAEAAAAAPEGTPAAETMPIIPGQDISDLWQVVTVDVEPAGGQ
jgi:predicted lipoprotein with Yx(FWY)xxD motif/cytochrome c5